MKTSKTSRRRAGFSLVELVISTAAAATLMVGMASAVAVSTKTLNMSDTGVGARTIATDVQRDLLADLQRATGFTERTANAVTMIVPDRTRDGRPDKIRYAWSGVAGAPLTLQVNGGTVQTLAANVQSLNLSYATKTLVAPMVPDEAPVQTGRVLFLSGGTYTAPTFLQLSAGQSGTTTPTASEIPKINLMTGWGMAVTLISASQPATDFANAIKDNDVIFVSSEAAVSKVPAVQTTVAAATIGVVNENPSFVDALGFCVGSTTTSGTTLVIGDNAHYITQGYTPLQQVVLFKTAQSLTSFSIAMSPDASILATNPTDYKVSFGCIAAGKRNANLTAVPNRRVQLPWAAPAFDATSLSTDGLNLFQLAMQWGAGAGGDGNPLIKHVGIDVSNTANSLGISATQDCFASPVTLSTNAELLELSAFVDAQSLPMRFAIYSDSGGAPDKLLAQTGPLTGGLGWLTGAVPSTKLSPGNYWLAISFQDKSQQAFQLATSGISAPAISTGAVDSGFPTSWGKTIKSYKSTQLQIYGAYIPTP